MVLHHYAVVGMKAFAIAVGERIGAVILVTQDGNPTVGAIKYLESKSRLAVALPVGLPCVNDPRFDFQFIARENLDADAVKKPRRVRRGVVTEYIPNWVINRTPTFL